MTYKITCKACGETYVGETSKNAYTRGKEHITTVAGDQAPSHTPSQTEGRRKPKPTLAHYVSVSHGEDVEPPRFKMEVTGVYGGDALLRQVSEAIRIKETRGQMNRQEEWRQIQLPRLGLL